MLSKFLYKSYRFFYAFRHWRKRRITPAGHMVLTVLCICSLLGGGVLRHNIYQAALLFFVVAVLSVLLSFFPLRLDIWMKRHLPRYGSVGVDLTYDIEIENQTGRIQKGLILVEELFDPRPDLETLLARKEPDENRRNAWDRRTMYYRWSWLLKKKAKAVFRPVRLPDLLPGTTVRVKMSCRTEYRGYLHFTGFSIARPDLFGLFCRLKKISQADRMLILPQLIPVEDPDLSSNRHFHAGGVNLASSIGNSDEFMSLRYYRPGDPLRSIHWRSFAKTRELVIKEFEDEHFVRHALILDTFCRAENENLFESAVKIAASYTLLLQGAESILDLMFVGHRVYRFSSGRGLGQTGKMMEVLACVESTENRHITDLTSVLEPNINRLSGVVCVFLGWEKEHRDIVNLFDRAKIETLVVIPAKDPDRMKQTVSKDLPATLRIQVVPV